MKRSRVWLELRIGNKSLAENNVRTDFAFGADL